MQEKIDKALEIVKSFNRRENLFTLAYSDYPPLTLLKDEFVPYKELWETAWSVKTEF